MPVSICLHVLVPASWKYMPLFIVNRRVFFKLLPVRHELKHLGPANRRRIGIEYAERAVRQSRGRIVDHDFEPAQIGVPGPGISEDGSRYNRASQGDARIGDMVITDFPI